MRLAGKIHALAAALFMSTALPALADTVTIKDVTGRSVEVNTPVKHMILGEGRQIYFLAALDKENPFEHVVGATIYRRRIQNPMTRISPSIPKSPSCPHSVA